MKHKVKIQFIFISVNTLKKGFVVCIDKTFGVITDIDEKSERVVITTPYNETREYSIEELRYSIVKFIAVMKDLKSFPIIHGDFTKIIHSLEKEKMTKYINGTLEFTGEGFLEEIVSYPQIGDVVELISLRKAEDLNLKGKENRIGLVEEIKDHRFMIKLPTLPKAILLKRAEFDILSGIDKKKVFKLKE